MRRLAVAVLVLSFLSSPLPAQPRQDADTRPPLHREALELLAAADTVGALAKLRELTDRHANYGPGWLLFGKLLAATASEVELEFATRMEARKALERAYHLMPGDPFVMVEYGLLLLKQGMRVDAAGVLQRVMPAAEKRGVELSAIDRGRMHYALGKIYGAWWEDREGMVANPRAPVSQASCPELDRMIDAAHSLEALALVCPAEWWGGCSSGQRWPTSRTRSTRPCSPTSGRRTGSIQATWTPRWRCSVGWRTSRRGKSSSPLRGASSWSRPTTRARTCSSGSDCTSAAMARRWIRRSPARSL